MGVESSRIIYAHTVKSTSHMRFAENHGVELVTFDAIEELYKMKGKDFNFHVGEAYKSPEIYTRSIERAKAVFDIAVEVGKPMTVLDIGGGFPGGVCDCVRRATDLYFPASSGVQIIAEPGQFYVSSAYVLAVRVMGKRSRQVLVDGAVSALMPFFTSFSVRTHVVFVKFKLQNLVTSMSDIEPLRKGKRLTLDEQRHVIRGVRNGQKKCDVAAAHDIPDTLSTILKGKDDIIRATSSGNASRKKALKKWRLKTLTKTFEISKLLYRHKVK
ncbi:hypothetical protein HPB48_020400 [Haemaphysalis longicornis]|uniref:Orn/DAP/Arg decarboxylase 2 N-terminal domain-containing protein n=1 Tax=Haemaphysalis longicornis TaxID=44386 RepID=A0A9J6G674_HAELO|nr:hypothetical protein HPB48_020400 [Haemaphysalis longicornis]